MIVVDRTIGVSHIHIDHHFVVLVVIDVDHHFVVLIELIYQMFIVDLFIGHVIEVG